MNYEEFLIRKKLMDPPTGIENVEYLPEFLFDHQMDIVKWSLRRGRSAIFAGTGLGKTAMELVWAKNIADYTRKPVLIFAPLSVSYQHVREGNKFGIEAKIVSSQKEIVQGINITNYQKIDHFDIQSFGGIVLDESSILKGVNGHYRNRLIDECKNIPFRLAATATPAPNDFMELGNHAEFVGAMSYTDMLATFFTHDGGETQKWRLKGHAENEFWKWMASWAVMLRNPSDLGYSNDGYDLPELRRIHHVVKAEYAPSLDTGLLFPMEAITMQERLAARRDTIKERVSLAAKITPKNKPFVWWCNLNAESEALARAIPGSIELRGSDSDESKEEKIEGFLRGDFMTLITKASIAGFGLNFQHCADTGFVGLSDSFEQVYQAVRRFWRFGQKNIVTAHFIADEREGAVVSNIRRKERDAERMANAMIEHMADLSSLNVRGIERTKDDYNPTVKMEVPEFLEVYGR